MPSRAGQLLEQGRKSSIANQRILMAWVFTGFGVLPFASGISHLA
jgi:uncharacterized membrane protein YidH (DUF202 family)